MVLKLIARRESSQRRRGESRHDRPYELPAQPGSVHDLQGQLHRAPFAFYSSAVYLAASVNGTTATSPLKILLNTEGLNSNPSTNQTAQTGMIALGTSGGNDNDYDTYQDRSGTPYIADCCGGTLGALVEDTARNQYILSNNHVLAESDQATHRRHHR